jgi:hypothetical protein
MDTCELTLIDLLSDPMTLAVMAADRVDPAALAAALSGLARRLEFARPGLDWPGGLSSPGRQPAALSSAHQVEALFANSLRPVKRAPTDPLR